MAQLVVERFEPAVNGLDTDSTPGAMPEGFAPEHRNWLVHQEGRLPMRGPLRTQTGQGVAANTPLLGATWVHDDKVLVATVADNTGTKYDPLVATWKRLTSAANIATAVNTAGHVYDADTDTPANVTFTSGQVPSGRGAALGKYVYGYCHSNGTFEIDGRFFARRDLLRWNGTTTAPVAYSNAPRNAIDVIAHLGRLWVLGGSINHLYPTAANLTLLGKDNFTTHATGSLIGKTAESGGVWAEAGDTDDWSVTTNDTYAYRRPPGNDADLDSGQHARLGSGTAKNVVVVGKVLAIGTATAGFANSQRMGIVCRYTDTNNWLALTVDAGANPGPTSYSVTLRKRKAGAVSTVAGTLTTEPPSEELAVVVGTATDVDLSLRVDTNGVITWTVSYGSVSYTMQATDADFADGGTLANGGYGIYHAATGGIASSCSVDAFEAREFNSWDGNTLFYSDLYGPIGDATSYWQDNATGLINQIVVAADVPGDVGVGLAHVGQDLMVLKRNSIHVLYGYSPATFNLRTVATDIGCLDAKSIVEYNGGVYWLSDEGYMYFDGTEITNVSTRLTTSLGTAAFGLTDVDGSYVAHAYACKLSNEYLMLTIFALDYDGNQTPVGNSFCGMLHMPTGRWTRFTSGALNQTIPLGLGNTANHSWLFDGTRLVTTDYLTRPELVPDAEGGKDIIGSVTARINSEWHTRLAKLATPQDKAQLSRILVDYVWMFDGIGDEVDGGEPSETISVPTGWYVRAYEADGDLLLSDANGYYQLPKMGDPSSYLARRRHVKDNFTEAHEVQLRISWEGDSPYLSVKRAEVHDMWLEYQVTRPRRSS